MQADAISRSTSLSSRPHHLSHKDTPCRPLGISESEAQPRIQDVAQNLYTHPTRSFPSTATWSNHSSFFKYTDTRCFSSSERPRLERKLPWPIFERGGQSTCPTGCLQVSVVPNNPRCGSYRAPLWRRSGPGLHWTNCWDMKPSDSYMCLRGATSVRPKRKGLQISPTPARRLIRIF